MSYPVRRNLENWLDDPRRSMDEFVRSFFDRPLGFEGAGQVKVDVTEDDAAYTVHAELPGVTKEDIEVQIEGNLVALSAEVKRSSEKKEGDKLLHSERYYGRISRSFRLAHEIDDAGAQASFDNGVLSLVLPKKAAGLGRRKVEIK
ncbi:molecular chaperone Hsp20 [Chitiniphilus shinanonensis]|uniref:Molecular chaperone Hsp20 n=1 Tax=Chitiniphilus shinanonensis TaxID=553088 RepID=A0ABQ6BY79_9NEIS|nr:Hsp20/alpha crystallin family protein [Chitiniphilus shinanonensis]GLS06110.1 molecular chaperone Hsp20 [Chitiniphilus shinanonensis]